MGWQILEDMERAGVELTVEQQAQVMRFYEVRPAAAR
jgi:hypothetical protein